MNLFNIGLIVGVKKGVIVKIFIGVCNCFFGNRFFMVLLVIVRNVFLDVLGKNCVVIIVVMLCVMVCGII